MYFQKYIGSSIVLYLSLSNYIYSCYSIGTCRTKRQSLCQPPLQHHVYPRRSHSHLTVLVASQLALPPLHNLHSCSLCLCLHLDPHRKLPMALQQRKIRRRFERSQQIRENEQSWCSQRTLWASWEACYQTKRWA